MTIDELIQYLYSNFGNSKVLVRVTAAMGGVGKTTITEEAKITLYTNTNQYHIVAKSGDDYLGCVMSSRKQRPGEDWFRGGDLPDGKLNKKTLRNIINAIVRTELQDISKSVNPPGANSALDE